MHDDAAAAPQFRPASAKDYTQYSKNLQQVINQPLQKCQEVLAKIYGYSGAHELRQVLRTKGEAGFFDDDLNALPYNEHVSRQQARRDRVREMITAAIPDKTLAHEWGVLCQDLGLFHRPTTHRARFHLLQEAVRLIGDLAWPAEAAVEICFAYDQEWDISFDRMGSAKVVAGSCYDPRVMIGQQRAFREAALFLEALNAREEQGIDVPALDQIAFGAEYRYDAYTAWQSTDWSWGEYVTEILRPHLRLEAPVISDEDEDAAYEEMLDFTDAPTEEVARSNPFLKEIPNVVEIARHWHRAFHRELAQQIVDARSHASVRSILKTDRMRLCLDGQVVDRHLRGFVSLGLADEIADDRAMAVYAYDATFLHETDDRPPEVIGVMHGLVVLPFKGRLCPCDEDFMWGMDSISAMANDVWKVIVFDYFKRHHYTSVLDFVREHDRHAFVTANVEIAPAYRGRGVLEQMANLLCAILGGGVYNQYDMGWRQLSSSTGIELGLEEDQDDEDLSGVAAIIFPVEGTAPPSPIHLSVADLVNIGSPKKVRIPPDRKIEARRQKLERHFLGLQGKIAGEDIYDDGAVVDVLVYDPWAYPVT